MRPCSTLRRSPRSRPASSALRRSSYRSTSRSATRSFCSCSARSIHRAKAERSRTYSRSATASARTRFSGDQLRLGERLLIEAAALGITTLAASGDLGFQGCFTNKPGALFPSSSPFATSVGGTDLTLTAANQIAAQVVWSTFATQGDQVGTGGGRSKVWQRPSFQRAPGIGPQLQQGKETRLAPDIAAMASFTPGIAVFDQHSGGWGGGGGTSAATPLEAAIVALVIEQERKAGRPRLGLLSPLLYTLARGRGYGSIFYDVTKGTSSRRPNSAIGQTPAGGAAQPGYDLATGLGSLNATAFADAAASSQDPHSASRVTR